MWSVISNDDQYIYIGLQNGSILSYSIDELKEITIESYKTLWKNSFRALSTQFMGKLSSNTVANIKHAFIPQKHKKKRSRHRSPMSMNMNMNMFTLPSNNTLLLQNDTNEQTDSELIIDDIRIDQNMIDDIVAMPDDEDEDDEDDEDMEPVPDNPEHADNDITCSCMNLTSSGVLLCSGYRTGEVYVYNLTECESMLEIHTRLSPVTALLLLCINGKNHDNDGILFIGYQDGFVQIFNCDTGINIFSKQCHYGAVNNLVQFEQDYYVFSVGDDNAICSFLIYSQLVTMKNIILQIEENVDKDNVDNDSDDDSMDLMDRVKWNFYRGHTAKIANLYRNQWCLRNDYVAVELESGDIFVWSVATTD